MTLRDRSLVEAAKAHGVTIAAEVEPNDGSVTANGLRLHYLDWGNRDAPWLLCLHGRFQTAHLWDFLALALCTRYHIVCPDLRGHGDSDWSPDRDYSLPANLRDLEDFVITLGPGPLAVVGLSVGARLAFTYAARHPDRVTALVLVEGGPEFPVGSFQLVRRAGEASAESGTFDAFVERALVANPRRSEASVRGSLAHNLRQVSDGRWTWKYDPALREPPGQPQGPDPTSLWADFRSLACPTLLVRGAESDVLPAELFQRMAQALPTARGVEIPGAAHQVPGDNPSAFEKAVREFLEEVLR